MRTSSFKRTVGKEKSGGLTLKPSDTSWQEYGILKYQGDKETVDKLRQALLDAEKGIFRLSDAHPSGGKPTHNYPDDHLTGRMTYYNLVNDEETWHYSGYPLIKEVVADFLSLKPDERIAIKSWGNVLRAPYKIFPHLHFGIPDNWFENKTSVCGNIFLGSEVTTATTYILNGKQVDIPNVYGELTLFPPNVPHAVREYNGDGVRVSAAFDCFAVSRDASTEIKENPITIKGDNWIYYTHH